MAKGSGGARSAKNSQTTVNQSNTSGGVNDKAILRAIKKGWTNEGGGVYDTDTKYGTGSVVDSGRDEVNMYRYGQREVYFAHYLDEHDQVTKDEVFASRSAAKSYVEQKVMEVYKKKNKQ